MKSKRNLPIEYDYNHQPCKCGHIRLHHEDRRDGCLNNECQCIEFEIAFNKIQRSKNGKNK